MLCPGNSFTMRGQNIMNKFFRPYVKAREKSKRAKQGLEGRQNLRNKFFRPYIKLNEERAIRHKVGRHSFPQDNLVLLTIASI